METAAPVSYHHTIDIALDPPLASAGEASLWVEISAGDPGGLSHEASTGGRSDATSPTLVLSRVDGDGAEQRFALPHGARAEGIRAKRRKSGWQLRVIVPVVEHAVEVEAKPEIEPIRPEPTTSGSDDDAASTQVPHLADLDFGPGCDACAAVGDAGDRRVVATRAIRRGEVVVFEAPVAAVKAGEPVASDALASAFCDPRCGSPGGCKGSPTRTTSQVEIPSMGAIIGEHLHGCTDDVGGDRCATPGLFGLYGGGAGGKGKTRRRRTEVAGDRVPNEWLLTHQLLELRAQLCAPGTRPREWAGNEMNNVNRFPSSKLKLDEFFLNWLSSPESQKLVLNLLDDAKAGRPLQAPTLPQTPTGQSPLSPSSTNALFSATPSLATPPLSPQKGAHSPVPGSPVSPARRLSQAARESQTAQTGAAGAKRRAADVIPRFYFGGEQLAWSDEQSAVKLAEAALLFNGGELDADGMTQVAREVCELPGYFAPLLMHRINGTDPIAEDPTGADASAAPGALTAPAAAPKPVTWTKFTEYWNSTLRKFQEPNARVFEVLRGAKSADGANGVGLNIPHLTHTDFRSVLRCVLDTHPGLEFLKDSPEFQDRYLETVTYRIFYQVNVAWNGRMTLRELRRSNLVEAMTLVDEEEDINKVLKYFSYEHFYVVYCKFWELDTDHDFLIDKEDLLRYGNHALTYRAVDRVFSQAPRKFVSGVDGKMGYEDFCWFILSEEDKGNPLALEYWMRCVDLDGDGVLDPSECSFFYEEQLQRMECLSQEPVLFEDILCQMSDMLHPETPGRITLRDLRRCKLAGNFFNVLFNLNKFIAFETRDPFLIRQEREEPHLTEWDRFARQEYIRLSMEEEEGMQDGNWDGDGMDPSPF